MKRQYQQSKWYTCIANVCFLFFLAEARIFHWSCTFSSFKSVSLTTTHGLHSGAESPDEQNGSCKESSPGFRFW